MIVYHNILHYSVRRRQHLANAEGGRLHGASRSQSGVSPARTSAEVPYIDFSEQGIRFPLETRIIIVMIIIMTMIIMILIMTIILLLCGAALAALGGLSEVFT